MLKTSGTDRPIKDILFWHNMKTNKLVGVEIILRGHQKVVLGTGKSNATICFSSGGSVQFVRKVRKIVSFAHDVPGHGSAQVVRYLD